MAANYGYAVAAFASCGKAGAAISPAASSKGLSAKHFVRIPRRFYKNILAFVPRTVDKMLVISAHSKISHTAYDGAKRITFFSSKD
jgi:hypothetical protein